MEIVSFFIFIFEMAEMESTSPICLTGPIVDVYLLGNLVDQTVGMQLPSYRQALGFMLYTMRTMNLPVRKSARLAVREVLTFWREARIPTQQEYRCVTRLEIFYNEHRFLAKTLSRTVSKTKKRNELKFCDKLDDLFDIAYHDALKTIERLEDKNFLLQQRKKGRRGHMINVSKEFMAEMQRRMKCAEQRRLQKMIYTSEAE